MNRTVYNHVVCKRTLSPLIRTDGTANGTSVDGSAYRSATLVVQTGALTDGTVTVTVEDSPNGSTGWAAVATDRVQGSLPAVTDASTDDNKIYETGIVIDPARPHLRGVLTTASATSGGATSALILLSGSAPTPVTH